MRSFFIAAGMMVAVQILSSSISEATPRYSEGRRRDGQGRRGARSEVGLVLDAPEKSATLNSSSSNNSNQVPLVTGLIPQDYYDGNALRVLKRLRTNTIDPQQSNDPDQDRTSRVATRAATVQGMSTVQQIVNNSELRVYYDRLRANFRSIQQKFKVGLYDNGSDMSVSQTGTGKKLLELDLGVDPFQGMSPVLRFGDTTRLRYDPFGKSTLLEYSFDF